MDLTKSTELTGAAGVAGAWDGRRLTISLSGGSQVAISPGNFEVAPQPTSSWASAASSGGGGWAYASASASAPAAYASASASASTCEACEEMRPNPAWGGVWPYCIVCNKWSDDAHRKTTQHIKRCSWWQPQQPQQPQPYFRAPPSPPSTTVTMLAAFEGQHFGEDYLNLPVNARVELSGRPEEGGWAHGIFNGATGFFPAAYAR